MSLECCGSNEKYVDGTSTCTGTVEKRRQNTQYENDESNWVVACEFHFEEIQAYWAERWAEYWSSVL